EVDDERTGRRSIRMLDRDRTGRAGTERMGIGHYCQLLRRAVRPILRLQSESGPAPTNSGDKETQKWRILTKRERASDTFFGKMVSDTVFQVHLDDFRRLLGGAHDVSACADRHERRLSAIEAPEPPTAGAFDLDAAGNAVQAVRVLRSDVGRTARRRPQVLDLGGRI